MLKPTEVSDISKVVQVEGEAQLRVTQYDLYERECGGSRYFKIASESEALDDPRYKNVERLFADSRLYAIFRDIDEQ